MFQHPVVSVTGVRVCELYLVEILDLFFCCCRRCRSQARRIVDVGDFDRPCLGVTGPGFVTKLQFQHKVLVDFRSGGGPADLSGRCRKLCRAGAFDESPGVNIVNVRVFIHRCVFVTRALFC